jgi:hypothetical protein
MLRDRAHVQELVCPETEELEEGGRKGVRPSVEMEPQEVVDSPPETDRPEDELVHPPPISRFERGSRPLPRQIEASPSLNVPK